MKLSVAYGLSAGLAAARLTLDWVSVYKADAKPRVSPDGQQYLAAGRGEAVPSPYSLRWILPALAKDKIERWVWLSRLALVALGPLTVWFMPGPPELGLFAAALVIGLPGVFKLNVALPVLSDAAGAAGVLATVALQQHVGAWAALPAVCIAAGLRESSPVFAALAAADLRLLLGLLPVASRYLIVRKRKAAYARAEFSRRGIAALTSTLPGRDAHQGVIFTASKMLLPWGVCLIVAFSKQYDPWLLASLAVAYGQLALAADRARIYQCAFPLVVRQAAAMVPSRYYVAAAMVHWFHPWQTGF